MDKEQTLGSTIQIACLPNYAVSYYPTGSNIQSWVIGWGYTNQASLTLASALQNVEILIYDSNVCSGLEPSVPKNWNSQVCAGYLPGGKSACNGDSGGSLFVLDSINDKKKYISVGIVSYGNGTCGVADNPQ